MPDEPGVAPGSPLSQPPPGTPQKGAQPPPGSDSEHDSGFSDSGSEHLGRCEGTDTEEPPGPGRAHLGPTCLGHALPGPQPPGAARDPRPLLVLLRPGPDGTRPCHHPVSPEDGNVSCHTPVPPGELSPCPRGSPLLRSPPAAVPVPDGTVPCHHPVSPGDGNVSCHTPVPPGDGTRPCHHPVSPGDGTVPCHHPVSPGDGTRPCHHPVSPGDGTRPCHHPVSPGQLSPCPRGSPRFTGTLLAALALRTGALLRHNRRTQSDIATLRRHTRLLARATRDPRAWPRLCHLLRVAAGPSRGHREPPGFGEGAGGE